MTDINIETGDPTYVDRVKRYEYIQSRLATTPKPTLAAIGKELGISKQNVSRILLRRTVRPSGRPRSNKGRRDRLVIRLEGWQKRRNSKVGLGLDTSFEDNWIAKLETRIKALV